MCKYITELLSCFKFSKDSQNTKSLTKSFQSNPITFLYIYNCADSLREIKIDFFKLLLYMRSNNPPFTLIYLCQDICRLIREGFIYLVDKGISSKQARYITILEPSVISLAFDVHVIFKMCRY